MARKKTLKEKIRKSKYKNFLDFRIKVPENRFVIYTRGRTGSTVLTELLNCHPKIFCDVEIFNSMYCKSRVTFPFAYINSCSKRATIYKKECYGFKVKIAQLRYEQKYRNYDKILKTLFDRGWKFIHLKRMNFLRHKLSSIIATQTKIYHIRNGDKPVNTLVHVNPMELLEGIKYGEEVERTEEENLRDIDHIKVHYEEDILDNSRYQETADRIFRYLGLESAMVGSSLERITTEQLQEMILNYDEIYKMLKDTPYEKYLYF